MLDILYLVPNLGDPAVGRRLAMLREGGARVTVAGFRRSGAAPPEDGAVVLGETYDSRFGQRMLAVARAAVSIRASLRGKAPDLVIARNLEMLVLAQRVAAAMRSAIVYECLDIHRLVLRNDWVGRALRGLETLLLRKVSLVITSSPAFVREYFDKWWSPAPPSLLVENKVHDPVSARGRNPALQPGEPLSPLKIGWFGVLRCRQSLSALAAAAGAMEGRAEVILRGRPARHEFDDFDAAVAVTPHLRFEGPYRNPADLHDIYSGVHLAWAIDLFEEGQNSAWLLPNRIYEGCLHGAIPVALAGTETAAFLSARGIGIVLPDIAPETLSRVLGALDGAALRRLAAQVAALPRRTFADDPADCRELVRSLAGAARRSELTPEIAA